MTSWLGGEVGLMLLLQLGAVSALAVAASVALLRAPKTWHRDWLPDLAFASGLVIQLAILAEQSLRTMEVDIDSMRHATALLDAHTLGEAIQARGGTWAADYILQGPVVHLLRKILPIDPLGAYRLLAFGGAAATALLLRGGARRLGAGPWGSALAGLLPLTTFGPAWLILTLDDNAAAAALEWAFVFALMRGLATPHESGSRLRAMVLAGLLLGLSVSFHRKAFLWAALLPLAPLVSRDFRTMRALSELAVAGLAAAATHLVVAALFLPGGLDAAGLMRLVQSPHHQNPAWWLPASGLGVAAQAAATWDGLRSTLIVFPLVTELLMGPSRFHLVDVLVPLCVGTAAVAAWRRRGDPSCRLLAIGLSVHCAHSLLYEPRSIERWDIVLAGCGVLVAASVGRPRREGSPQAAFPTSRDGRGGMPTTHGVSDVWRKGAVWLWLMLAALQHLGTGLYADAAEVARRLRPETDRRDAAQGHDAGVRDSLEPPGSARSR